MSATTTPSGDSPSRDGFMITANDNANLTSTARAIYVGASGNITGLTAVGSFVTLVSVPQGSIVPLGFSKIFAANTTAANLVGFI